MSSNNNNNENNRQNDDDAKMNASTTATTPSTTKTTGTPERRNEEKNLSSIPSSSSSSSSPSSSSSSSSTTGLLLLSYQPIGSSQLTEYVKVYESYMDDVKSLWKQESDKYEESIFINLPGHPKEIPRRNYANPQGVVQDDDLYPYHSSCYSFLGAYDSLYDDDNDKNKNSDGTTTMSSSSTCNLHPQQPVPPDSISPARIEQAFGGHDWFEPARIVARQSQSHYDDDDEYDDDEQEDNKSDDATSAFLLCSLQSIMIILFQRRIDQRAIATGLTHWFVQFLQDVVRCNPNSGAPKLDEDSTVVDEFGYFPSLLLDGATSIAATTSDGGEPVLLPQLPAPGQERRELLLRLLKHAMSELQRDHLFAGAILVRLSLDGSFNHVPTFQRILTILCSEYILCSNFEWAEADDHDWDLWKFFLMIVESVFCFGPDEITTEHALSMAAFGRYGYLREYGHLADIPSVSPKHSSGGSRGAINHNGSNNPAPHTLHLKRYLLANRMEEDEELEEGGDPEKQSPTRLVLTLIRAWGRRGERELARIAKVLQNNNNSNGQDGGTLKRDANESIARYLNSYYNCLRAMVSLSHSSAQILPKSERLYQISSFLIRSIAASLIHIDKPSESITTTRPCESLMDYSDTYYLGAPAFPQLESVVLSPFRLAHRIRHATEWDRRHNIRQKITHYSVNNKDPEDDGDAPPQNDAADWSTILALACQNAVHGQPHESIRDSVRSLYLRDSVYMSVSGMGYGDFVLWCRFPIQPLDPVMFYHDCNHIMPEEVDDDDSSTDDDDSSTNTEQEFNKVIPWAPNENGFILAGELWCHFNFSLLAMVLAWREPWTPASHMSYSSHFRKAMYTLVLCLGRNCASTMPAEVIQSIISYLPRGAWPEDEFFCWQYDCALKQMATKLFVEEPSSNNNNNATTTTMTCINVNNNNNQRKLQQQQLTCRKCRVPRYCSKSCLEQDYKDMHKRICVEPPYCAIGKEHEAFCQSVANGTFYQANNHQSTTTIDQEQPLPLATVAGSQMEDDEDEDDDDGSWESMDTTDDEENEEMPDGTTSLTQVLTQFMWKQRPRRNS